MEEEDLLSRDVNDGGIAEDRKTGHRFRTYKKRWFVLINLALLNLSMAVIWIGFSPVAYKASAYYETDVDTINWLSTGFIVLEIIFGILWAWLLNRLDLKECMLVSAWLAAAGAGLRVCSTLESLPHAVRLTFLFVGQYVVGSVQPAPLYCAPKMAAIWFPSRQRSIATASAGMANPFGVVVAGVISPLFIDGSGILMTRDMLAAYAIMSLLCAIMTSIVMTTSNPPSPPSFGGTMTSSRDFIDGVKKVLRNKDFLTLMVAVGTGIGLYSAFATLFEQILCPWGYSDTIIGACWSVTIGTGLCGSIVMSLIVDKTKRFSQSLKFMLVSAAIATIVFSVTLKIYMGYFVVLIMGSLGFLAFGISPIGMETGAEVTFPVGISIGTAMLQLSGQAVSIIMILILQSTGRPMTSEELVHYGSECHSNTSPATNVTAIPDTTTYDLSVSAYVISGMITLIALSFVFLFQPTYRRMQAETEAEGLRTGIEDIPAVEGSIEASDTSTKASET